ncbi:hypothetical protein HYW55_01335 [Candidatus Gottesmanbacteria bacterium]|nr:hypothetical protein [Candidatus Gottesmanbacteria bacterium]
MEKRKILIIKIGSSTLLTHRLCVDEYRMNHIAKQIKMIQDRGWSVLLILSGAVAVGSRYIDIPTVRSIGKMAAAGIGQVEILTTTKCIFQSFGMRIAQVLLTKDNTNTERKKDMLKTVISLYIQKKIIPVFNENDVLDLYSFGGNDYLAQFLAKLVGVSRVSILSSLKTNGFGVGGGVSKREIVSDLQKMAIPTFLLNGKKKDCLLEVV